MSTEPDRLLPALLVALLVLGGLASAGFFQARMTDSDDDDLTPNPDTEPGPEPEPEPGKKDCCIIV